MTDELKLTVLKLLAVFYSTTDNNARYSIKTAVRELCPEYIGLFL